MNTGEALSECQRKKTFQNSLLHKGNENTIRNCQNLNFRTSEIKQKAYNNPRSMYSRKRAESQ